MVNYVILAFLPKYLYIHNSEYIVFPSEVIGVLQSKLAML